ncbi:DUF397 domain-containing protein [Streptomyces sp. 1331.2]|uniref:DUF397 domain-containing protein n=1 Tax=Streptomyces sp. 1331.2 TaxID=1938835 RepID=UPI000BCF9720|nr:DUF397 domain-containing protein [Streptomyces sp. 1331.2]SOB84734.1 protein of unknown function [Streptomyces sp. 1331.2]
MSADLTSRRSSHSGGEGGNCIEVASELPITWRKSSHSNPSGGDCIEIADGISGIVPVRDSKDPSGPALAFTPEAWKSFIAAIRCDGFPTAL